MKPGATGLTRLIDAAGYSRLGLEAAWKNEAAFRQELVLAVFLLPLGAWLGENGAERALLMGSLLLVLIVEVLNSGLEAVVDRIGPELHPLAGRAKDMGSAAVLLALLTVGVVWGAILWARFF